MQPTAHDDQHKCDLCHKTYRRRDLVQRHRRHCDPRKTVSKRKSCDACVQTRSKCCLSQPTCSRCSRRGLVCEYAAASGRSSAPQNAGAVLASVPHSGNLDEAGMYLSSVMSLDDVDWTTITPDPSRTRQVNDWPSVNIGQTDSDFDLYALSTAHEVVQDPTSETSPSEWHVQQWNATLPSPPDQTTMTAPSLPHHAMDGNTHKSNGLFTPSLDVVQIIQILRTYPICLSSDDYHTPLLHRELYGTPAGDITTLPKSTTAVMCALGLQKSGNKLFLKRAMSAERQRLVEGFPKHSCIEEWDTIHAMWLYEMMELPDTEADVNDHWRLTLQARGLHLPILLKMTRRFCRSHPEAVDPSAAMTTDAVMRYAPAPSAWLTWLVGETSRRMVFLAHIVNYFATRDGKTGEVSPYYEPLDDETILNMPLPCSPAAWKARTEQEWLCVLQKQNSNFVTESHSVSLLEVFAHEPTIRSLMAKFTKDHIRSQFAGNMGFQDTESFRNLVVHCALEQLS